MDRYNAVKTYSYIKGYAVALGYENTVKALSFARKAHGEQKRKDGQPYIIHPLTMASHAITLGIADDELLASILLHDVVEDCNVSIDELPVSDRIKDVVDLVTFKNPSSNTKVESLRMYYYNIGKDKTASLVKIFDRCHNVSSMAGTFTVKKIEEYIEETRVYVLPLLRQAKDNWPELSNVLFVLKYHINSVIDSLSEGMKAVREQSILGE